MQFSESMIICSHMQSQKLVQVQPLVVKLTICTATSHSINSISLYHNPDLDDQIFDCLLPSMAAVQAEDVCASFLFVGDLNGHHQEWLGYGTVMELRPLTSQQSLVAISWLSAQPMHVVEHLTS